MTAKLPAGPSAVPPSTRVGRRASLDRDAYFAVRAVHWSTLKAMAESPAHFKYASTHKVTPSPAMLIGQAVHCAMLEPDRFDNGEVLVWEGTRRTKAYKDFALANPDKIIVTQDENEDVLGMRDSLRRHPIAKKLFRSGWSEVPLFWTDNATGLRLKARLDWLRPRAGVLVELKTTRQLDEHSWVNTIARSLYHGQVAMYVAGLRAVYGMAATPYLIGVENSPPYDAGVFPLDDDWLYAGECLLADLLAKVAACRAARRWPGRYPVAREIALPGWVQINEERGAGS